MSLFKGTVSVFLSFIVFTGALPAARISREALDPRSPILVKQKPETGYGPAAVTTTATFIKECIPIQSTFVPTSIEMNSENGLGTYRILKFPTSCPVQDETAGISENLNGAVTVNRRKPICSFKLGKFPIRTIDVGFFGQNSDQFPMYKISVDNASCHDLCSASPWSKYAQSVELRGINGRVANNHLHVYSDSGCNNELSREVKHGANFVDLTLEDKTNVINSFVILRDDNK